MIPWLEQRLVNDLLIQSSKFQIAPQVINATIKQPHRMNTLKLTKNSTDRNAMRLFTILTLVAALSPRLSAEDSQQGSGAPMSVLPLMRMGDTSLCSSPDNEASVALSDIDCPTGGKAILMTVPVDFSTGQAGYPKGWPRLFFGKLEGSEEDWGAWDNLEFMVMAKVSRPEVSRPVFSLLIGSRPNQFTLPIKLDKQGEWQRVTVPVSEIKAKGVPVEKIPRVTLSIAESNYEDKDIVELFVGGFRLTRAPFGISSLMALDPALPPGAKSVRLEVSIIGSEAEIQRGIPLVLRQKDKVLQSEMPPWKRGAQVYELDLSKLNLPPGDYEVVLFPDDPKLQKVAKFKIVEGPWSPK